MAAVAAFADLGDLAASLAGTPGDGAFDPGLCGPPVPRPQKVFGIGLNYRSHAAEANMHLPDLPLVFTKFPSCIVGPHADIALSGDRVDWEVEVVAVIGRRGRHIAAADAWSYVAGLTLGQDVSDRTVQMAVKPPQFSLGKSFDTFGPTGPVLASVDSFANPDDIAIACEVNGDPMQGARTSDLIFSVPLLVEYLSGICTLEPGDLIFTGTPEGVGMVRGRFLGAGDVVTSTMDVVGALVNRCVA
jgi:2-keto-4-pentenoate hydratase/2-oxohepta-3-ene-1,7-dioic acid hydratase in catechol pathway